ncbi:hypothetical protein RhiirA5_386339 [Rhizophagus irregularis]|uniref:Uncharacterized protein n=1 Tax=Rhizophagus irregularis TaxID=588596 RepID=A0A2N0NK45_9GLOM|nr:hypothetical protein RhiirA5_386339 [Rhizophagus irregularis]
MESFSEGLKERNEDEELHITPTQILLETPDKIDSVELQSILQIDEKRKILEKCKRDLNRLPTLEYQRPKYLRGTEFECLERLQQLGERSAKETKKIAKRVYELFIARGIQALTVVEEIKPTYLSQMNETVFYEELLPEARRIAQEESGFAGAHP